VERLEDEVVHRLLVADARDEVLARVDGARARRLP
jgi:hypothetical protein